jgi:CheY-like chemotaxis protein
MAIKILLADDSLTIQKVVELTFSDGDTRLVAVGSGDKAVQALDDFQPDLVLADVVMPGLTGYEVCEAVKKRAGGEFVPVVLLTGTFEPFDRTRAERVGSDAIVTKPFDSHALQGLVRELVSKARAARADAEAAAAEVPPVPSAERPTVVLSVADLEETVGPPVAPIVDTARTQSFAALDYTAPPPAPFEEAAAPQADSVYSTRAMKIPSAADLRLAAEEEGLVPPPPFAAEPLPLEAEAEPIPFEEQVETGPVSRPAPELPFVPPPPPPPPAFFEPEPAFVPPPPPPPPAFHEAEPAFVPPPPPPPPAFYEPEPALAEEVPPPPVAAEAPAWEMEAPVVEEPVAEAPAEEAPAGGFEIGLESGPDTEPVPPVLAAAPVSEPFLPVVGEEPAPVAEEPETTTPFLVETEVEVEMEDEAAPVEPAFVPEPVEAAPALAAAEAPVVEEEAAEPFPEMDEPAPAVESEAAPWDEGPVVEIPPPPPELSAPPEADAPEPITRDLEQDLAAFEASGRVLRRPEIWERHAALLGEEVPADIDLQPVVAAEPAPEEPAEPSPSELEELAAASRLEDLSRLIPPASVSIPRAAELAEPPAPAAPEAPAAAAPSAAGYALTEADVDRIARRVVELLSEKAVRDIAWEVVPEYAERLVRERIAEVEQAG